MKSEHKLETETMNLNNALECASIQQELLHNMQELADTHGLKIDISNPEINDYNDFDLYFSFCVDVSRKTKTGEK